MDNPFERYGLDPREGIAAITARLKELAEDAKDDAEREQIRAAWEELTLHPARRLRAALFAHPETRPPLGAPPPRTRTRHVRGDSPLGLRDLAARPSVLAALGPKDRAAGAGTELVDGAASSLVDGAASSLVDEAAPPLEDDPVL